VFPDLPVPRNHRFPHSGPIPPITWIITWKNPPFLWKTSSWTLIATKKLPKSKILKKSSGNFSILSPDLFGGYSGYSKKTSKTHQLCLRLFRATTPSPSLGRLEGSTMHPCLRSQLLKAASYRSVLVGGFNHLEKWWSSSMGRMISHTYPCIMENKSHVWNHQPGSVFWLLSQPSKWNPREKYYGLEKPVMDRVPLGNPQVVPIAAMKPLAKSPGFESRICSTNLFLVNASWKGPTRRGRQKGPTKTQEARGFAFKSWGIPVDFRPAWILLYTEGGRWPPSHW